MKQGGVCGGIGVYLNTVGTGAAGQVHESRRRVDVPGSTDCRKAITHRKGALDALHEIRHLAKPHNIRTPPPGGAAVRARGGGGEVTGDRRPGPAGCAPGLEEFAMHVHHRGRSGALVEVVDVLGNQGERTGFAGGTVGKLSQSPVGGVRGDGVEFTAPLVVKTMHCFWRAGKCLRGSDLFDPMAGPQAAGGTESTEPGFHGHARAGQDEDVLVGGGTGGHIGIITRTGN